VLPLLTQHYLMLQCNLLYTAVTRAKKLVVIVVGSRKALAMAVKNNKGGRAIQRTRRSPASVLGRLFIPEGKLSLRWSSRPGGPYRDPAGAAARFRYAALQLLNQRRPARAE